jgi:hypothetical protein
MERILEKLYRYVRNNNKIHNVNYSKTIIQLVEQYDDLAYNRSLELVNGGPDSEDFACRYPDFDKTNKKHIKWLLMSLEPSELRAIQIGISMGLTGRK